MTGLALLLATGCGGGTQQVSTSSPTPSPTPSAIDLRSEIVLYDNTKPEVDYYYIGHAFTRSGIDCEGRGTYAEMSAGHTVDLIDATGTVVASASFEPGAFLPGKPGKPNACLFTFTFPDVPTDLDLFKMSVGGTAGPTFTNADLMNDAVSLVFNQPAGS